MSWHFSRALGEEYLAASCLDTELFVQSNTTPMHGTFWLPGKMTDACPRSRSGMTYAPLTETLGAGLLTWFQAASHVRTYQQPAREKESLENGQGFGRKWRELSVKYDPDSCGWKTLHSLFQEVLEWCLVTFPKWGMMRDGELWERTTPEHLTNVTECGFWRTPQAWNGQQGPKSEALMVKALATGCNAITLVDQVKHPHLWPTPTACMHKGSSPATLTRKDGRSRENDRLDHKMMALNGGSLNPTWVEWLMGWPPGWTDCAVSATDKFQRWLDMHGIYYSSLTPPAPAPQAGGDER